MRALLETERGREIYARRKATVEPVIGQIRASRRFGQFSFRGLLKNRCEWLLVCLTHNIRSCGGRHACGSPSEPERLDAMAPSRVGPHVGSGSEA
jgi:hypothetical protein